MDPWQREIGAARLRHPDRVRHRSFRFADSIQDRLAAFGPPRSRCSPTHVPVGCSLSKRLHPISHGRGTSNNFGRRLGVARVKIHVLEPCRQISVLRLYVQEPGDHIRIEVRP